jgi:uncharacterized membrane protein YfcA
MPDALAAAPGAAAVAALLVAAALAGLARGFSGFGTALVYIPIASRVAGPVDAVVSLLFMDLVSTVVLTRHALGIADRTQALRLAAGGVLGVPVGVWLLTAADPETFRWIASLLALGLLAILAAGVRYDGPRGPGLSAAVGGLGGVMGGFASMAGPPVILFYLSGREAAATVRANIIVYFAVLTVMSLAMFVAFGLLTPARVLTGLALAPVYTGAVWLGARLFRVRGDAFFRGSAYVLVGLAALSGLPVFG